MTVTPEDGLRLVDSVEPDEDREAPPRLERGSDELEALRDEFVDAFNARDLEAVLALASADIECPDVHGDGAAALAEELDAIWRRSPGAILTRAFLDGSPCGMAWLPDEDGCWARAALVCFDCADGLLSLVEIPDDVDALERAEADDPVGEELEEGTDWAEWDNGEATVSKPRDRSRP